MKKTWILAAVAALTLAGVVAGCSKDGGGDGVNGDNAKKLTDMSTMAKTADGDFDKLSEDGKRQALQMANGNEASARQLVKMMAHPPNEGRRPGPPGARTAPGGP